MNVIALAPRQYQQDGTWQTCELDKIRTTFVAELASGEASGWHVAATEVGDPQFYLLGPPPDENCVLSISRLGRLYILEDGAGHVLYESGSLANLTRKAKAFLRETKGAALASIAVLLGTIRHHFEERIEPLMAEGEELLLHIAPKLAAVI